MTRVGERRSLACRAASSKRGGKRRVGREKRWKGGEGGDGRTSRA